MPVRESKRGARAYPESTTHRTPWMVRLDSAMGVDRTTRRRPASASIIWGYEVLSETTKVEWHAGANDVLVQSLCG